MLISCAVLVYNNILLINLMLFFTSTDLYSNTGKKKYIYIYEGQFTFIKTSDITIVKVRNLPRFDYIHQGRVLHLSSFVLLKQQDLSPTAEQMHLNHLEAMSLRVCIK